MTTCGWASIAGGGECWLYAYMPTNLSGYFPVTASATALASVTARSVTLPSFAHFAHSHQPPPSLGSTETECFAGSAPNCANASSATSLRRAGFEMQNLV